MRVDSNEMEYNMVKRYWFCKYCGHFEEIGKDRADVIMGLCPKCYHFMTEQDWDEGHVKKAEKWRAQRIIHRNKKG